MTSVTSATSADIEELQRAISELRSIVDKYTAVGIVAGVPVGDVELDRHRALRATMDLCALRERLKDSLDA